MSWPGMHCRQRKNEFATFCWDTCGSAMMPSAIARGDTSLGRSNLLAHVVLLLTIIFI